MVPVGENDLGARGRALAQRRIAHGIRTAVELADRTGMSRRTIAKVESGEASDASVRALEKFFDDLDQEVGLHTAPEAGIEFNVTGPNSNWRVVISGPASIADELRRQVVELLRDVDKR